MVAESLSGTNQKNSRLIDQLGPGLGAPESRPAAREKAGENAAARSGKRHRLGVHLLIGLIMALTAVVGYATFGPSANAAVDASQLMVDVSAAPPAVLPQDTLAAAGSLPVNPAGQGSITPADIAAMQAQMNELAARMQAIQASYAGLTGSSGSAATGMLYLSPDNPNQSMPQLQQRISAIHGMWGQMPGSSQAGGMPNH